MKHRRFEESGFSFQDTSDSLFINFVQTDKRQALQLSIGKDSSSTSIKNATRYSFLPSRS